MKPEHAHLNSTSFGTYFFLHLTDDYAIVAIDSRVNFGAAHDDNACKILTIDEQTIFFSQGVAKGPCFVASQIAKSVHDQQAGTPSDFSQAAGAWVDQMITSINADYLSDRDLREALANQTTAGFFVGLDKAGTPVGATAEIVGKKPPFSSTVTPLVPDHDNIIIHNGYQNLIDEVDSACSPRARVLTQSSTTILDPTTSRAQNIYLYVKAVRDWSEDSKIGGDIATVVLKRGLKWRWFNRPACCPEN